MRLVINFKPIFELDESGHKKLKRERTDEFCEDCLFQDNVREAMPEQPKKFKLYLCGECINSMFLKQSWLVLLLYSFVGLHQVHCTFRGLSKSAPTRALIIFFVWFQKVRQKAAHHRLLHFAQWGGLPVQKSWMSVEHTFSPETGVREDLTAGGFPKLIQFHRKLSRARGWHRRQTKSHHHVQQQTLELWRTGNTIMSKFPVRQSFIRTMNCGLFLTNDFFQIRKNKTNLSKNAILSSQVFQKNIMQPIQFSMIFIRSWRGNSPIQEGVKLVRGWFRPLTLTFSYLSYRWGWKKFRNSGSHWFQTSPFIRFLRGSVPGAWDQWSQESQPIWWFLNVTRSLLPTQITSRITVIRAPFVFKKSREQFEQRWGGAQLLWQSQLSVWNGLMTSTWGVFPLPDVVGRACVTHFF